jgi:leader peptidase (prepilin peptidase)/N-methyltransferase
MLRTIEGLSNPPSHCPRCGKKLIWYDNLPVIGWIELGGKCRFCRQPISIQYPIIESIAGLLFVGYYVAFFIFQIGPCAAVTTLVPHPTLGVFNMIPRGLEFRHDWVMYLLYMLLVAGLLASSLIDAELFVIPVEIPWVLAAVGIVTHMIIDKPTLAGSLNANPGLAALAAGGGAGLIVSIVLFQRGILPQSFPDGEPMQDVEPEELERTPPPGKLVDYEAKEQKPPPKMTRKELSVEMGKEMLFLLFPMVLATGWWFATKFIRPVGDWWNGVTMYNWVSGLLGAVLGALVGALVVWVTRILGTLAFGRLAMGLGDVHLMFGVGAIIGAAGATIAFFLAPFFGIATAIYMLLTGKKRELPYGPYLSMATAFVLLFSCPIIAWLTPGVRGLSMMIQGIFAQ